MLAVVTAAEVLVTIVYVYLIFKYLFICWRMGYLGLQVYESQRAACGSRASLSTMWVPGTELRSSYVVTSVFTH